MAAGMIAAGVGIVKNLVGIGADWMESKREEKAIEARGRQELKRVREQARIEKAADEREHTQEWEEKSPARVAWANDVFTAWTVVILSAPFVPPLKPWVDDGIESLAEYPDWVLAVMGTVWAAAFGDAALKSIWQRVKK